MSIKCYNFSYKPAVEKAMAEVGQYGFLWANMGKLNSVKNDSVQ